MKHLATMALMLNLGIAGAYEQQTPVAMTFSGTAAGSTIDLKQPNTNTGEEVSPETARLARSPFDS